MSRPEDSPFASLVKRSTAPQEPEERSPEVERPKLESAPLDRRRVNFLVDGLVAGLFAVFATEGYGWLVLRGASHRSGDGLVELPPNFWLGFFIVGGMVWVGYFVIMELTWGRTVGKLVSGTKVVSEDGSPADESQIITRTFVRLIPFEFLSFTSENGRRGLHDRMSNTMVILCRQGPSKDEDPLFD